MKTSITNLKGIETFALKSFPKLPFHNKEGKPYQGGIVYIGIDDEGKVLGVSLTPFQKDHVLLSVQDTFSRFEPPVDSTMYEVRFIPVIRSEDEKTNFTSPVMDSSIRKTPHAMRTSRYCWCDDEAKARFDVGTIDRYYVIEVEVFPWNPNSKLAVSSLTRVHPLFCNEEKLYFIRRLAGLHQPSIEEVIQMAESDAYAYYAEMARCELFSRHRSCSDGSVTLADNMKKQCIIASSSIERETVNLSNGERERNGSAQVATEQKQKP